MNEVRIAFIPIVRPLFRGASMGLWEESLKTLETLKDNLGFTIAYQAQPIAEEAEALACVKAIQDADIDLVLIQHVTFATGELLMPILEMDLPTALWAMPEFTTKGPLPQNALCGMNMGLSFDVKRELPLKWFYGKADQDNFKESFENTIRAIKGMKAVQQSKVLWVGGTAPGFFRLESVPELSMQIEKLPLEAVSEQMASISEDEVQAYLDQTDEPLDFEKAALSQTLKLELALKKLSDGYDGVALRCWPEIPEQADAMCCATFARLADDDKIFACEGDMAGLASMLTVGAISGQSPILMDLSHIDANDDACMFWHCGNVSKIWAKEGKTNLINHFNRKIPAVRHMQLHPGKVSGLRFLEDKKAVVFAGEVIDRSDGFDGVFGWISKLRWAGQPLSASSFLANILHHRLPHHLTWGRDDHEQANLECCFWMGYQPLEANSLAENGLVSWPA